MTAKCARGYGGLLSSAIPVLKSRDDDWRFRISFAYSSIKPFVCPGFFQAPTKNDQDLRKSLLAKRDAAGRIHVRQGGATAPAGFCASPADFNSTRRRWHPDVHGAPRIMKQPRCLCTSGPCPRWAVEESSIGTGNGKTRSRTWPARTPGKKGVFHAKHTRPDGNNRGQVA